MANAQLQLFDEKVLVGTLRFFIRGGVPQIWTGLVVSAGSDDRLGLASVGIATCKCRRRHGRLALTSPAIESDTHCDDPHMNIADS